MSARKSVYVIKDQGCDGGESPNAYVPRITVEVRVHFPPNTVSKGEVLVAMDKTFAETYSKTLDFFEERDSA